MTPGRLMLDGPVGRLEAEVTAPRDGAATFAAVICHPHPTYGGTMQNPVVHRLAHAVAASGGFALRFNFRGTGLSAGEHDRGTGERDDVRRVIEHANMTAPGLPLILAGYSFGAWVGLTVGAEHAQIEALIGVGLATTIHDFEALTSCRKPKLFVQGAVDPLGPAGDVEALVERLPEPKRLELIAAADHFFAAGKDQLSRAIEGWLGDLAFGARRD